ncbi:hypothetical protein FB451DRAFT_1498175 [Mycena latifolia]|nr:hypothetical protein FB451DRAFT_1498175 [Mycena latifolia]
MAVHIKVSHTAPTDFLQISGNARQLLIALESAVPDLKSQEVKVGACLNGSQIFQWHDTYRIPEALHILPEEPEIAHVAVLLSALEGRDVDHRRTNKEAKPSKYFAIGGERSRSERGNRRGRRQRDIEIFLRWRTTIAITSGDFAVRVEIVSPRGEEKPTSPRLLPPKHSKISEGCWLQDILAIWTIILEALELDIDAVEDKIHIWDHSSNGEGIKRKLETGCHSFSSR